jgi:hypothetical protein
MHVIKTSALCGPQAIVPPANQPINFTCNWPTNQPEALLHKQPTNRSLKVGVGWLVATLVSWKEDKEAAQEATRSVRR